MWYYFGIIDRRGLKILVIRIDVNGSVGLFSRLYELK